MCKGTVKLCLLHIGIILYFTNCNTVNNSNKVIFNYNETTNIQSLDPAFAKNQSNIWAVHQLYNTLVQLDSNSTIVPSLAKEWVVSANRKQITFTLRKGIYFHPNIAFGKDSTRQLVASDVVYSLQRIIDKKIASPGAWIFNGRVDTLQPFLAINDTTFQLNLIAPFQPILGILSMQYCSIVPHEVVTATATNFRRAACGTGPFMLEQWEEGQALTMIKNPHYFEQDNAGTNLPYIDGIKITFFDSKATEFLKFKQHEIDFINDIDASFKDELLSKKGNLRPVWQSLIKLNKHPYLNLEYMGILMDTANALVRNSPLQNKLVRQAINYGFDRKKMMLYLRNSIGTSANSGAVPCGLPSFDSTKVKGYYYNPTLATKLLAQAGYSNGKGLPAIKVSTVPIYADLASYIAKELQNIGITLQVDVMQKALLIDKTSKCQVPLFRGSWIADYPDAENYLSLFYSKNPAPPNYTRYNNPTYDKLYETALLTTNNNLRYSLYQQLDALMIADAPIIPLWYDEVIHLVQNNISGFKPNSLNLLELRYVKKLSLATLYLQK